MIEKKKITFCPLNLQLGERLLCKLLDTYHHMIGKPRQKQVKLY